MVKPSLSLFQCLSPFTRGYSPRYPPQPPVVTSSSAVDPLPTWAIIPPPFPPFKEIHCFPESRQIHFGPHQTTEAPSRRYVPSLVCCFFSPLRKTRTLRSLPWTDARLGGLRETAVEHTSSAASGSRPLTVYRPADCLLHPRGTKPGLNQNQNYF